MKDELKLLGMAPVFGAAGALATAAVWQVFNVTLMGLVPARLAVLSCLVAGLAGPLVVWGLVWFVTRSRPTAMCQALRHSAFMGLGLVFTAELGFYIPLGFLAIAYS